MTAPWRGLSGMALSPVRRAARLATLFQTPLDSYRYARLRQRRRSGPGGTPVSLRLRALGGAPVLCRPGQDVWTLKHTFIDGFHLPPIELPDGAVILDLGSNVGYTVADMAHRYPAARILGVEMDATNHRLAVANTAAYGTRVTILHAAVWVHDGEIAYAGDEPDAYHVEMGGGSVPAVAEAVAGAPAAKAVAKRIGTLLAEHGLERVHYMKMDVEGAEADLLAGRLDWADRVDSIKVEIHPPASASVICDTLRAHGFTCSYDEQHWNTVVAVREPRQD